MKNRLFADLDIAESEVISAQNTIRSIHESVNNYNYNVSVPYTHKSRIAKGVKWTHRHETRYRNEIRFDRERFNKDLSNANQRLQEAQQKLSAAQQAIRQEIASTQEQIDYVNKLASEVNNLKSSNHSLQSKLPHNHVNSLNLSCQVSSFKQQKDSLANQINKLRQDAKELPGKIQQIDNNNTNKKEQVESLAYQRQQASMAEEHSYRLLRQKLMSLSEEERAILAYETIATGNDAILNVLENCGFSIEKTAQIAVCKNQPQVFNYCMDKGIKFDLLVSEKDTLALSVINSGNVFFINKLFSSNQDLKFTTFIACAHNDFNAVKVLLQHDRTALHKFKEAEGCGFGVVQYAIASNNKELIEFIIKHDSSCFEETLVGYAGYLQMALRYNCPEIIKIIGQNFDIRQEISELIKTNQVDMFDRLTANIDLSQKEVLSIIKSCVENGRHNMAEAAIQKVADIKQAFMAASKANDIELANALISLKPEELNFEYIAGLMNSDLNENNASLLTQILSVTSDETEQQLAGENDYEIQINQY